MTKILERWSVVSTDRGARKEDGPLAVLLFVAVFAQALLTLVSLNLLTFSLLT
jgi:hypothetical protein